MNDDIIPFWDEEEMINRNEALEDNEPIDYGESDYDIDPDMGDQ